MGSYCWVIFSWAVKKCPKQRDETFPCPQKLNDAKNNKKLHSYKMQHKPKSS